MGRLGFSQRSNYSRCKNSAIYSLAMREHSRQEIYNKLKRKDYVEGVDIDALLDELEACNYLNNERFVESFIRSRVQRGQGSNKIINELKQRGISDSQIQKGLKELKIDWLQIAVEQKEKKFGTIIPKDFKEKMKQMRFLVNRGFDTYIIHQIFE